MTRTTKRATGRNDRIREFFAANPLLAYTARQIRDQVEPGGKTDNVGASLADMVTRGELARVKVAGGVRFQAKAIRAPTGKHAPVIRTIKAGAPNAAPSLPPPGKPKPRVPTGCSLDGIPTANRTASERISDDIAAFQKRGGKIERLGTTQFFKHIKAGNDE